VQEKRNLVLSHGKKKKEGEKERGKVYQGEHHHHGGKLSVRNGPAGSFWWLDENGERSVNWPYDRETIQQLGRGRPLCKKKPGKK